MKEVFKVEKTRRGHLALWEWGGGFTSTGDSTIICGKDGRAKKAIYIKRKGHLANAEHALVPVSHDDYIVTAYHHKGKFVIRIYQVVDFEKKECLAPDNKEVKYEYWCAIAEERFSFSDGEWSGELPVHLLVPVQKAMEKATCYHCREPHYVAE